MPGRHGSSVGGGRGTGVSHRHTRGKHTPGSAARRPRGGTAAEPRGGAAYGTRRGRVEGVCGESWRERRGAAGLELVLGRQLLEDGDALRQPFLELGLHLACSRRGAVNRRLSAEPPGEQDLDAPAAMPCSRVSCAVTSSAGLPAEMQPRSRRDRAEMRGPRLTPYAPRGCRSRRPSQCPHRPCARSPCEIGTPLDTPSASLLSAASLLLSRRSTLR